MFTSKQARDKNHSLSMCIGSHQGSHAPWMHMNNHRRAITSIELLYFFHSRCYHQSLLKDVLIFLWMGVKLIVITWRGYCASACWGVVMAGPQAGGGQAGRGRSTAHRKQFTAGWTLLKAFACTSYVFPSDLDVKRPSANVCENRIFQSIKLW